MDIGLPILFAKQHRIKLEPRKSDSPDNYWLLQVIKNVAPEHEDYIYLCHTDTTFTIIHRMQPGWENNLEEEIDKAFRLCFDEFRQRGSDIGDYELELENISFVPIEKSVRDLAKAFKRSRSNFANLYSNASFVERRGWVSRREFEILNEMHNDESISMWENPYDDFLAVFEKYPKQTERREVPFSENAAALEKPELKNTIIYRDGSEPDEEENPTIMLDNISIYAAEPHDVNMDKIQKLAKQFPIPHGKPTQAQIEKANRLKRKINELVTYDPSSYTYEYEDLVIPDIPVENMIFEFVVTLDVDERDIQRRFCVPSTMSFVDFDKLLTHLFRWVGFPYHLSSFNFQNLEHHGDLEVEEVLEWTEEDLSENSLRRPADNIYRDYMNPFYYAKKKDIKKFQLSDYFPKYKTAQYRYDYGDNWFHALELVAIHDANEYNKPLPYLLDSFGTAPVEDMGGPYGFYDFVSRGNKSDIERYFRFNNEWLDERETRLQAPGTLKPLFEDKKPD